MSATLSNIFLSPVSFAFLGLVPIVILLYILKLRRTEVIIPSTFLWIKSLQDLTANAPFQRLRKNLLMFLQLLVLVLVTVALTRPFVRAAAVEGANYCVLIDRSASMQTIERDGRSRLEWARDEALRLLDNLGRDDKMMVVSFAESAEVLCELTDDRFRIRRAILSIEAADTRTNIRDVMQIARSLAPDNPDVPSVVPNLALVLLSDGKLSDLGQIGARGANMTYLKIGETSDNAGIVQFSARRPADGAGEQQTFALVRNEGEKPLTSTLSLYFNDTLLAVSELSIPPRDVGEAVFVHGDIGTGILKAVLDHEDALGVDNQAWLALRPSARVRVLVVTDPDSTSGYYLKRALALEPRVELSTVDPANYAPTGNYDLVLFDNFAPEALPGGALVFFNALPPIDGLSVDGALERPPVLAVDPEHPVMRFLNPGNVGIAKAQRLVLPEGARTLVSTRGGPLIADVSRDGRFILVVAFDVAESNWPLELSFPLFMQNLVSWAPRASVAAEMSIPTGRSITILPSPDVSTATVTLPDGHRETVELAPLRPVYFGGTNKAGVYVVQRGEEREQFAVNLLDANESSVTPTDTINFGRGEIVAERDGVKQTRELWRWFILAAVAVLAVEWWLYSRRAWL